jgi:hypothetical protein
VDDIDVALDKLEKKEEPGGFDLDVDFEAIKPPVVVVPYEEFQSAAMTGHQCPNCGIKLTKEDRWILRVEDKGTVGSWDVCSMGCGVVYFRKKYVCPKGIKSSVRRVGVRSLKNLEPFDFPAVYDR